MILDLHTHSVISDDGRAKVDNYCQWIKRKELPLDGIVLTEHRQFDAESDYRALEDQYGLLILKASEVETDYGHCLVFGVNDDLVHAFDFARLDNPLGDVIDAANRCGAFAAPCHPGRKNVGLFSHYETKGPVDGVEVVEIYNGGSIPGEDEKSVRGGGPLRLPRHRRQRLAHRQPDRPVRHRVHGRHRDDRRPGDGPAGREVRGTDMASVSRVSPRTSER